MTIFGNQLKDIPLILRISCIATLAIGLFQLLAFALPSVSPQINGIKLTSPNLMFLLALIHLTLGWGIITKKKWSAILILILPLIQYSIIYLEIPLPDSKVILKDLAMTIGWMIFFIIYYFLIGAWSYFK